MEKTYTFDTLYQELWDKYLKKEDQFGKLDPNMKYNKEVLLNYFSNEDIRMSKFLGLMLNPRDDDIWQPVFLIGSKKEIKNYGIPEQVNWLIGEWRKIQSKDCWFSKDFLAFAALFYSTCGRLSHDWYWLPFEEVKQLFQIFKNSKFFRERALKTPMPFYLSNWTDDYVNESIELVTKAANEGIEETLRVRRKNSDLTPDINEKLFDFIKQFIKAIAGDLSFSFLYCMKDDIEAPEYRSGPPLEDVYKNFMQYISINSTGKYVPKQEITSVTIAENIKSLNKQEGWINNGIL